MTHSHSKEQVTILGCGSSTGTPRIGGDWGSCDPSHVKNRRLRSSILYEKIAEDGKKTIILIDTSPDLRAQLLAAQVNHIDAVFFTHDHADQTHGIDDLRTLFQRAGGKRIATFMSPETHETMEERFAYLFKKPAKSLYPPILKKTIIEPHQCVIIKGAGGDIMVRGVLVRHGAIDAYGYQIGDSIVSSVFYSPDVSEIALGERKRLRGVGCWIIDALRREPHISHTHLAKSLKWLEQSRARMGILTNMHIHMDYETLRRELPSYVLPGYDGMSLVRQKGKWTVSVG